MRKGKRYGTVMVDIHTNRIVDMIETREYEPVSEWLASYPNLKVISQDGSLTYKNAIESSHSKATQVSDRFHLLKNLTKYVMEYLKKKLKAQIALPSEERSNPAILSKKSENRKLTLSERHDKIEKLSRLGMKKSHICKELSMDLNTYKKLSVMASAERENLFKTNVDFKREESVERKMKKVKEVREMKSRGYSNRKIGQLAKLDQRTVAKYIHPDFNPVYSSHGTKRSSMLIPYMRQMDSMLEAGAAGTDTIKKIEEKGYTGSASIVRHYIADWKKRRKHLCVPNMDVVERNDVFKLLFYPLEKVQAIS
jgi:DNA-binding NarL/FixJ family response regulator